MRFWVALLFVAVETTTALAWETGTATSPADDTRTVWASVKSTDMAASLTVQCENRTTLVALQYPEKYLADLGAWGSVTLRIDRKAAFVREFRASNDHKSLALIGRKAVQLVKAMGNADQLFVRILPVNETVMDAVFPLKGLDEAIQKVRAQCNW